MRKRIAMVLLGLSLAVGTPAATNMFPAVSAQTVQAAGKTGWTQESGTWYFYKDGVKQTGWQTWDGKKYYLNADGTMKANEWMIDTDGSVYYFRSWGGAYLNCKARINGRSYTFGADSKVQGSQWVVKGGKWYLVKDGKIAVKMSEITSRIFIEACVKTTGGEAMVRIRDAHTNIVRIEANGEVLLEKEEASVEGGHEEKPLIHNYTLKQIYEYAKEVPAEEIEFIKAAYEMNYALFEEGIQNPRTTYARYLLEKNGGKIISDNELKTASLLCNAAIEARVIGLDRPAMSITGSGAHGIIATMPLYGVCKIRGLSDETLYRATALSYLICMYIKEYSGKLSAFCGCGIAAGTGMACALVFLHGGDEHAMARTINNMSSSITGMICHGGNKGCTMKGVVAVNAAFQSADFAMHDIFIDDIHGINGFTPEDTMRHMGEIASPGMIGTEKTIVDILQEKGE